MSNKNALIQLADGGTISYIKVNDDNYVVHTFNDTGTFTPSRAIGVEYLIVAGGGGGGGNSGTGGGGGAGGSTTSGNGGSGLVVVRWLTADATGFSISATGTFTTGTDGSYTWYKWTATGTLVIA